MTVKKALIIAAAAAAAGGIVYANNLDVLMTTVPKHVR